MYHSTRDQQHVVSGAQAILQGIADDGGLFVPEKFENLSDLIGLTETTRGPPSRIRAAR